MNDDIKQMIFDATIPHLSRYMRKELGYHKGCLKCEHCGRNEATINRQRTAYADSDNMATLCPSCQKDADEYWDEMWEEYYNCIMG